ncbi:hypothetical protein ACIRPR_21695 [Streptomyces griseoflavus]|uniref:effector-associated constant component EACC1 n=1 Tax=Streptomyces griseoflavus TaxID=35619 RepID=UPI003804F51C
MRVTLAVASGDGDEAGASEDLYEWLRQDPDVRPFVRREVPAAPEDGAMGALGELVSLLLAPGGPTAAIGAAVVVWLQGRRGNQTVTLTLPDGTQVVVSSEKVRGLTAEGASELAERVAAALQQERREQQERQEGRPGSRAADGDGPRAAEGGSSGAAG